MSASDPSPFPSVGLHALANAHNEWVALQLSLAPGAGDAGDAYAALFAAADLLAASAPLQIVLPMPAPPSLDHPVLAMLPPGRIIFCVPAAICLDAGAAHRCQKLQDRGYRFLVDGVAPPGSVPAAGMRAFSRDCSAAAPAPFVLPVLTGPHLARRVDTAQRYAECRAAGFAWFSGQYPFHPAPSAKPNDGTSRKHLMSLLGLLARDAESRELETLFKQDPALAYHLLKLVNCAAYAHCPHITSFGQAINLLGRRQLQRWLQLLLYARQQVDGLPNLLLPQAALRASQMEALCKLGGMSPEQQDLGFMTGVFSLLDVLFEMPMADLVSALNLDADVVAALLERRGRFGDMLALVEQTDVSPDALDAHGIGRQAYWTSLVQACQWAIQVSRNH
jgi:c-di-GMP phosphodiesterase